MESVARFEQQAFAGAGRLAIREDASLERQDPPRPVLQAIRGGMDECELGTVDEDPLVPLVDVLSKLFGVSAESGDPNAVIEMQLAGTAVVVKPVGHVRVLLDLQQRDTFTDRVNRAGRNVEEITGADRVPGHDIHDRTVESRLLEIFSREGLA